MNRSAARRGYLLIEIVITIALVSVTAGIATQLLIRTLATGRDVSEAERTARAADAAATALRRDVETADAVGGGKTGRATWAVADGALVRTDADGRARSFGPLAADPRIDVRGDRVELSIGEATWAFRPLADAAGVRP